MPNYRHDHVHLISPNALETAQFYERVLNAKRVNTRKSDDGLTTVELNISGSRVLVGEPRVQPTSAPNPSGNVYGLVHFGVKTDNIEAAVADLKAKGVQFRDEIRVGTSGKRIAFFWAPENVVIELLESTD
ncbi:VOC family protein [Chloroflexota bacterium]